MLTVAKGSARVEFSWPVALPAPRVTGAKITYPEALPGVDLVFTTTGSSYTQSVVVKSREAGRQGAVRDLRLGARAVMGSLKPTAAGGFVLTDRAGGTVLEGGSPSAWDSRADRVRGRGSVLMSGELPAVEDGQRDGDRRVPMGMALGGGVMRLQAPAALLDDPETVYPVVLDPPAAPEIANWYLVDQYWGATQQKNITAVDLNKVGYYSGGEGTFKRRILYTMKRPSSMTASSTVTSAKFYASSSWASNCNAGSVAAYLTDGFTEPLTWGNQPLTSWGPSNIQMQKGGRGQKLGYCEALTTVGLKFDMTNGVATRTAANDSWYIVELKANETSIDSWIGVNTPLDPDVTKRPRLVVEYNTVPLMFTASTACTFDRSVSPCSSMSMSAPVVAPNNGTRPLLWFRPEDGDVGDSLLIDVNVYTLDAAGNEVAVRGGNYSGVATSGQWWSTALPAGMPDGVYGFKARVRDGASTAIWSPMFYVKLDSSVPSAPAVSSAGWVNGQVTDSANRSNTFTLTAGAVGDLVRVRWNGVEAQATPTGVAKQFTYVALADGAALSGVFEAWSVNPLSGTASAPVRFTVAFGSAVADHRYLFNADPVPDEGLPPSVPVQGSPTYLTPRYPLTLAGSASLFSDGADRFAGVGVNSTSLALSASGGQAASAMPLVDSTGAFVAGAWVYVASRSANSGQRVILSQPSSASNGVPTFEVGFDGGTDQFFATASDVNGFSVRVTDRLGEVSDYAGGVLAREGQWVYVAVRYNPVDRGVQLVTVHEKYNPMTGESGPLTPVAGTSATLAAALRSSTGLFLVGGPGSPAGSGLPVRAGFVGRVENVTVFKGFADDEAIRVAAETVE